MLKKSAFNPEITRIKLNPEQAVLTCTCFASRLMNTVQDRNKRNSVCQASGKLSNYCDKKASNNAAVS